MKVILLVDIPNVGKKNDVKEVSGGHARNFLFPKKLAVVATEAALKGLEEKKAASDKKDAEIKKELEIIARELDGRKLVFPVKADESGAVYGSINKEDILNGLRDVDMLRKNRVEIKIDKPIKTLGEHDVEVDFKKGIVAKIKVMLEQQK
ncbi:MAG: 50S ribosomal protein L9 [Patescibacteria group bacterium]|nr:50S ribosomal protein L9 [Patescibacteria group bacterium]